ncbi:MAG TPA: hypothetical protein VHV27_06150 [Phenylobacterium sp.]|jgi:hypothetical protein|nr:hypothetical protein [Phenylobacterium sp.]
MKRPLKPAVWIGLFAGFMTFATGLSMSAARNAGVPGAAPALTGLALIGVLLFAGVAFGFKTGFFGGSDD